jgi:integral membrane protein
LIKAQLKQGIQRDFRLIFAHSKKWLMFNNPIKLFRKIALLEGVSYLVLLCIAMPLKYIYQNANILRIVGWIHGLLFIAFCILLLVVWKKEKWRFLKVAFAFIASLIPFGTFYLDRKLKS